MNPTTAAGRRWADEPDGLGYDRESRVEAIRSIEAEAQASRDMDLAYEAGREDGRADALREHLIAPCPTCGDEFCVSSPLGTKVTEDHW